MPSLKTPAAIVIALLCLGTAVPGHSAGSPGSIIQDRPRDRRDTEAMARTALARLERARAAAARSGGVASQDRGRGGPVVHGWMGNGTPVTTNAMGQFGADVVADGAGGALAAWSDVRNLSLDVFCNRLDANGNFAPGWSGAGLEVAVRDSFLLDVQITSDGANGAFVGFSELDRSTFQVEHVILQRVLGSGAIAGGWPAAGKQVVTGEVLGYELQPDGAGGVFVGWFDIDSQAWVLRLDSAGNPVSGWPGAGLPAGPAAALDIEFAADGGGGFFLAWVSNDSVLCTRYAGNGTVASGWTAAGTPVAAGGFGTNDVAITRLTSGDAMVTWSDSRNFDIDLFAARLNASGGFASGWGFNGVPVCQAAGLQAFTEAVSDGAGGANFIWADFRDLGGVAVYSQRITATGTVASGWAADGVQMCPANTSKFLEDYVGDGAGGIFAGWSDDPMASGSTDVYAQMIQGNGTRPSAYPASGLVVCNAANDQYEIALTGDGAGGAIMTWGDDRDPLTSGRVYAARIRNDGTPAQAALASAVAEPGVVRLMWFSPDGASFAATLEREENGGGFAAIAEVRADATGQVRYEDRAVAAGALYRYRLVVSEGAARTVLGEVALRVPGALDLAIEPARPNPTAGPLTLAFTLPSAGAATLDLVDIAGRRVIAREVGGAAGRHVLRVAEALVPGVYVVRLSQSGRSAVSRVVVME